MSEKPDPASGAKEFGDGMVGAISSLAEALAAKEALGRGGEQALETEITDAFGTFQNLKQFDTGCALQDELGPNRKLSFHAVDRPGHVQRWVIIGATPADFDPRQGGRPLEGAGPVGDYLLITEKSPTEGTVTPTRSYRYLDRADVNHVEVTVGKQLRLAPNPGRDRQITVSGTVEQALLFK